MKLEYLTLNKIVDTCLFCGLDNTPVSVLIAAPPGAGKTWSTQSIADRDFVLYLDKVYSPNEHRKYICNFAARTRLFINDDIGLLAEHRRQEFFGTFIMVINGELHYTVYKQSYHAFMNCSLILCCTSDVYHGMKPDMVSLGLHDRVIPILLGLSNETRHQYQKQILDNCIPKNRPIPRYPDVVKKHEPHKDLISEKDVEPRLLTNILRMSQYLTEDETYELIMVAHSNGKYEV